MYLDSNSEDDILIANIKYMGTIIALLSEHAAFPICYVWSDTSLTIIKYYRAITNQIESPIALEALILCNLMVLMNE